MKPYYVIKNNEGKYLVFDYRPPRFRDLDDHYILKFNKLEDAVEFLDSNFAEEFGDTLNREDLSICKISVKVTEVRSFKGGN